MAQGDRKRSGARASPELLITHFVALADRAGAGLPLHPLDHLAAPLSADELQEARWRLRRAAQPASSRKRRMRDLLELRPWDRPRAVPIFVEHDAIDETTRAQQGELERVKQEELVERTRRAQAGIVDDLVREGALRLRLARHWSRLPLPSTDDAAVGATLAEDSAPASSTDAVVEGPIQALRELLSSTARPPQARDAALLRVLERVEGSGREEAVLREVAQHPAVFSEAVRLQVARRAAERDDWQLALRTLQRAPLESALALQLLAAVQERLGNLVGAVVANGRVLAKDIDVVGAADQSRRLRTLLARVRAAGRERGPHARELDEAVGEVASSQPGGSATQGAGSGVVGAAFAARLLQAIEARVARGARAKALFAAREAARRTLDARVAELVVDLERRLITGPAIAVTCHGDDSARWIIDAHEATLGRGSAAIVVESPHLSRVHLTIALRGPRVDIEDSGSRNGTELVEQDGTTTKLAGAIAMGRGRVLCLGGAVRCEIAPLDPDAPLGPVAIRAGGTRAVLTLGQPVPIGSASLVRAAEQGLGVWRLRSGEGAIDLLDGDRYQGALFAVSRG